MKKITLSLLLLVQVALLNATTNSSTTDYLNGYLNDEVYHFVKMKYDTRWGASFYMNANVASDDFFPAGSGSSDRLEFQMAEDFSFDPEVVSASSMWNAYIQGIEKCNYVIGFADNSTENVDALIAEAKFYRAFIYFNFVRIFGDVPILEDCCLTDNMVRSPKAEVYSLIIEDLIESIDSLPVKSALKADEKYRGTKGAAQTLLGKVYLYNEQWVNAATVLEEVINSGAYALEADFADIWLEENEHGVESIFEFDYFAHEYWDWGTNTNNSNIDIQLTGIRGLSNSETYRSGWGLITVTQNLVDAFEAENDSVRKHASIIFADSLTAQGCTFEEGYNYTGYWTKKYVSLTESSVANDFASFGKNEIQLRYADVLLMAAEANAQAENDFEAKEYLNMVRSRANLPAVTSTGAQLIESIYKERRLELAMESNRFFDIQRWGKLTEVLEPLGFNTATLGLWPVPQDIIDLNPDIVQNPSYTNVDIDYTGEIMQKMTADRVNSTFPSLMPSNRWARKDVAKVESYKFNACLDDSIVQSKANYSYENDTLQFSSAGFNLYLDDFEDSYKVDYVYTAEGYLSAYICQRYDFSDGEWTSDEWNQAYTYDDNGYLTQYDFYMGDVELEKNVILWSNNYSDYESSVSFPAQDGWSDPKWFTKYERTMDDDKAMSAIVSSKDSGEDDYVVRGKYEYTYSNDLLAETSWYDTIGKNFELASKYKTVYTFDNNGEVASETVYSFDLEANAYGAPTDKTVYVRDSINNTEWVRKYTYNEAFDDLLPNDEGLLIYYNEDSTVFVDSTALLIDKNGINNAFDVFPNPAKEKLNLRSTTDAETVVKLYSIDGQLINSYIFTNSITIDVSEYEPQIYLLSIENDLYTEMKRIIIQ